MPALFRLAAAFAIIVAALGAGPVPGPTPGSMVSAQDVPEPQRYGRDSQGYAGEFADVLNQLDDFWREIFQATGAIYRPPAVIPLDTPVITGCGPADAENFAFYCPVDEAIYYSPAGFADHALRIGDFAPIVVTAHEWGHHVQWLAGVVPEPGNAFELQADCLAGAYASEAGQRGLLDPGDVTEAVQGSAEAGDPLGLPQDAPGAHGINDDRVISFMRGYLDGVSGCGLPLLGATSPADPEPRAPVQSLAGLIPAVLELPQGQDLDLFSEGATEFDDLVAIFPNPAQARERLLEWGWQENAFRIFTSDDPPPNAVGWVELGVHRFASADGAAAGLTAIAAARQRALGYDAVDVGLFGDQTEAMAGRAYNGDELVIYARRGNLVFRASGIAQIGDPTGDVIEALLIVLRRVSDGSRVALPELFALLPPVSDVLPGLDLTEDHARSAAAIAATFPNVEEAERLFQDWGWYGNAARVFTGNTPSGTNRVEVSMFRLADDRAAAAALPYFLDARATLLGITEATPPPVRADEARAISGPVGDGHEATVYFRRGRDLFRVTAIGEGNPMADIEALLR